MNRSVLVMVVGFVVAASTGVPATIPNPVHLESGMISGTAGSRVGVRVFRGIPFAAPPVGALRWRVSQQVAKWDGVRKAEQFGSVCAQSPGVGPQNVARFPSGTPMSEDCLYLNVWTAASSGAERRPVMVWMYGGGFTGGAGSLAGYDGDALAETGAVVVTFNYRVGAFGFFAHPELTKESGRQASGNYGMMDSISALLWVKKNIGAFGGDPNNVTIFGESAGAVMTAALVGSPEAHGLFLRAISQSGAWMGVGRMAPMRTLSQAEEAGRTLAAAMGAKSIADLRAKSADDVQRNLRGAGIVVDGWLIPEDLSITFAQRRQNDVDVLVGSNKDEGSYVEQGPTMEQWVKQVRARWGELGDAFLKRYPGNSDAEARVSSQAAFRDETAWQMRLYAQRQATRGKARAYLYYFIHEPATAPGQPVRGAAHTAEIPYVFNNLAAIRMYPDTSSADLASASTRDRALAETISSYWVNFARTGDPNGSGLAAWPAYRDKNAGLAMILGDKVEVERAPDADRFGLYDALYEKQTY